MAKPARRKCKICKEWFHPAFSNQWWCCPEHGTQLALELQSKQRKKAEKAAEKKRRREEQKQKDKLKIRKLALKPRSTLARGVPLTSLGVTKLNFCVRNGNRCILRAIITALFT